MTNKELTYFTELIRRVEKKLDEILLEIRQNTKNSSHDTTNANNKIPDKTDS